MTFDFGNFSPQAFERMVQALCVSVLGKGGNVFGTGPDGGRELTFDGEVPYPSATDRWSGYIVVQAKCREQLRRDSTDADWVAVQLRRDLQKFAYSRPAARRPHYYIICTNVTLSAVPDNGGKAKVERVFREYEKDLGLKGWGIWSADELTAFLENANDVRMAYTAWLTPSDVLSTLIEHLRRPSLERLLPICLSRDLRDERNVRMQDAGDETENAIPLDAIFIDLFIVETKAENDRAHRTVWDTDGRLESASGDPIGTSEDSPLDGGVVARLLRICADKLDSNDRQDGAPLRNRIVIQGGPGQGKSTLSQFLAQIARARLLQGHSKINPQTRDMIEPVLSRAQAENLPLTGPARFPIRIDAPALADELQEAESRGQRLTILEHITAKLSEGISVELLPDDVRTWLGAYPSLIILDGLDEVPPSGNRRSLVREVDALWDDLCHAGSDALVVVTTRPQGYNNDLNPQYWQHWDLAPLTSAEALRYARRLSEVRLSERQRRKIVLDELEAKSSDLDTSRLMTSPLQVTIMFGIALLKGSIPQDRWTLFDRYYTLLRDREARKGGWIASVIREYGTQIDAIHRRAGFLLHVSAESAGAARSFLSPEDFHALAKGLLCDEGYEEREAVEVAADLVKIATDRLVLLRARVEGRIAFDVRSLQESMAAGEIVSGPFDMIVERLRVIALSAHWKYVFRIAVSKIFSSPELWRLREQVVSICDAADNGDLDQDALLTRGGARLALDLVADGIAAKAPKFQRRLIRRALGVLDLGPEGLDARLKRQFSTAVAEVFRHEIVSRIGQVSTPAANAAWILLFEWLTVDVYTAADLIVEHWPRDDCERAFDIIVLTCPSIVPFGIRELIEDSQLRAGALKTLNLIHRLDSYRGADLGGIDPTLLLIPPDIATFSAKAGTATLGAIAGTEGRTNLKVGIRLQHSASALRLPCGTPTAALHSSWKSLQHIVDFMHDPDVTLLASCLRTISASNADYTITSWKPPWIIAAALQELSEGADLDTLAAEAEAGKFGTGADWVHAEERWANRGVRPVDIAAWSAEHYITERIGTFGAPIPATMQSASRGGRDSNEMISFVEAIRSVHVPSRQLPYLTGLILSTGGRNASTTEHPDRLDWLTLAVLKALDGHDEDRFVQFIARMAPHCWAYSDFVFAANEVGKRAGQPMYIGPTTGKDIALELIVSRVSQYPNMRGLLPFIAGGIAGMTGNERDGWLATLPRAAWEAHPTDESPVRRAATLLRLLTGNWAEEDVADLVRALLEMDQLQFKEQVRSLLASSSVASNPYHPGLLRALAMTVVERAPQRQEVVLEVLSSAVGARSSGLGDERLRSELDLPATTYTN
jgi:hypothetical protein